MKIGIDFSINSTAITIIKDRSMHLFSFVPNYRPELKGFKTHVEISDLVTITSYQKAANTKDPIKDQAIKLKNADDLSNQIIETIAPYIDAQPDIRIEGFSFGSKGNSFIDLVSYNTFLKVKLIQRWGHCISIVPPKSLKKLYTTNGNASKCDMVRNFINQSDSVFRNKLVELNLNVEGEFVIPKPVDDLIDSIALAEVLLGGTTSTGSTEVLE
jgi:hypothetical protein